jgi:quercetin dioxygenase-like cupin family protein
MRLSIITLALATSLQAQTDNTSKYKQKTSGVRDFMIGATAVKVLIDSATLGGGEVELARLTFPPNPSAPPRNHVHTRVEILYVLSGELDHIVNGVSHLLKPGMTGIVRPGDQVAHRIPGPDSAKVLVIWAPGGELARLSPPPRAP